MKIKAIKTAWYKMPGATRPAPPPNFDTAVSHIDFLLAEIERLNAENTRLASANAEEKLRIKTANENLKHEIEQAMSKWRDF